MRGAASSWTASRGRNPPAGITSAEPGPERLLEVSPRTGADERLLRLAALEEDHGRDREHLVARRQLRVLVDVDRRESDPAARLRLQLLEHRTHGHSKMSRAIFLEAVARVPALRWAALTGRL